MITTPRFPGRRLGGIVLAAAVMLLAGSTLARGHAAAGHAARSPLRTSVILTIRPGGHFSSGNTAAHAAMPSAIAARVGRPVRVTIDNFDRAIHTFYVPTLGVFTLIPAARPGGPGVVTLGWTARRAGTYDVRDVTLCGTPPRGSARHPAVRAGVITVSA